jgi:hypothetical protein
MAILTASSTRLRGSDQAPRDLQWETIGPPKRVLAAATGVLVLAMGLAFLVVSVRHFSLEHVVGLFGALFFIALGVLLLIASLKGKSPELLLGNHYAVSRDGIPVADLDLSPWTGKGRLTIAGKTSRLDPTYSGLAKATFVLEQDGHVLAEASERRGFKDRFELRLRDGVFELRGKGVLDNDYVLMRGDEQIGQTSRVGGSIRMDLPDQWPLAVQVFVFWIALLRQRQASFA